MDADAVAERLAAVLGRIERAADRAGREPSDVRLIGVSKFQPDAAVGAAIEAGLTEFGENQPQALAARASAFQDVQWHAIGALQTNKVRLLDVAASFHALDRVKEAELLASRRDGAEPLPCFVEVNIAGEESKEGLPASAVADLVAACGALRGITVVGLMCMPPYSLDPEASRPYFVRLRELAADLGLARLSMGTTEDFEVAVEEGATEVRVGRAIFGPRPG